jgi:hypothetical protein
MEHQLRDDRTAWSGPLLSTVYAVQPPSPARRVGFGPTVDVGVVGKDLGRVDGKRDPGV